MKGTLHKTGQGWSVAITEEGDWSTYYPLHPDDVKQIHRDAQVFDNIEARIAAYPDVEVEIVISALDFVSYATLVQVKEQTNGERFEEFMNSVQYPELDSTASMCEYSGLPTVLSYLSTVEGYPDESWEGCDGCTEQDEVMYKNGYVKGYNAAISELPNEISDEEIFYQKQVMNPYPSTKHFYTAWEKGFMECAKWYKEQLKKK